MRIAVDTNLVVRLLVRDDPDQTRVALQEMQRAATVVLPLLAACETAWLLTSVYRFPSGEVEATLRRLIAMPSVECDEAEIEAGLAMLLVGGDFADGVIAAQGRGKGAAHLVTFDARAVRRLQQLGHPARLAMPD